MLKIVPKPGFCLINIHKKSTDTLIKKVADPIDKLEVLDIPSASTDHGEFPVVDKIKTLQNKKNKYVQLIFILFFI